MVDYKQILRLGAEGVSQRGIADVLSCSRNTVASVLAAAAAAGIGFEGVADLGSDEVRNLVIPDPPSTGGGPPRRRAPRRHGSPRPERWLTTKRNSGPQPPKYPRSSCHREYPPNCRSPQGAEVTHTAGFELYAEAPWLACRSFAESRSRR